jgi:hypothetical protein
MGLKSWHAMARQAYHERFITHSAALPCLRPERGRKTAALLNHQKNRTHHRRVSPILKIQARFRSIFRRSISASIR